MTGLERAIEIAAKVEITMEFEDSSRTRFDE